MMKGTSIWFKSLSLITLLGVLVCSLSTGGCGSCAGATTPTASPLTPADTPTKPTAESTPPADTMTPTSTKSPVPTCTKTPEATPTATLRSVIVENELLFSVPVGSEPGEIGYGSFGEGGGTFWGPMGLAVGEDGTFYIVDEVNQRVQHYAASGPHLSSINYVHGYKPLSLVTATLVTTLRDVTDVQCDGRRYRTIVDWSADPQGKILAGGHSIEIRLPQTVGSMSFLHISPDGGFLVKIEEISSHGPIRVDVTVRRYDSEGNLLEMARVPLGDFCSVPEDFIAVGLDDQVYTLVPKCDHVEVQRLVFVPQLAPILPDD
jgi:hypothetical protein